MNIKKTLFCALACTVEVAALVQNAPAGLHALYVSLQQGSDVQVDWLGFSSDRITNNNISYE